jgi:hypothetical protein
VISSAGREALGSAEGGGDSGGGGGGGGCWDGGGDGGGAQAVAGVGVRGLYAVGGWACGEGGGDEDGGRDGDEGRGEMHLDYVLKERLKRQTGTIE